MSDLIDRQAAIDGKICIQRSNGVEIYDDYVVPVEYLEQLPPAQPEIVPCNYVKACNKATMDKPISAYTYLSVLADLKEHGYVLVDMREEKEK